ncbi:MAG: hypothetical protein ABW250_07995, partial [Pyrinomonadaceae bacterium]
MANSKQKPVPEGPKRSPGKSKFSMPRKEAPPIDGSYLDRLFTDFKNQSQEVQGQEFTTDPAGLPSVIQPESTSASAAVNHPSEAGAVQPVAPVVETREADLREPASPELIPFPQIEPAEPPKVAQELTGVPSSLSTPSRPRVIPRAVSQQEKPRAPVSQGVIGDDSQLLDKWKKKHRLSKGEFKVLRVMLDLCQQDGGDSCFVKIPHLMEAAELKERQTQLVLKSLRELGLIEKIADYSNV